MSSIDTNVGSPPIVSRTSPACSTASTRRPSASISAHCSSVYGLVTRGVSWIRRTDISNSNSTSHSSTAPVTGAAEPGSGRGRQRQMAFAGEQAGRRIEPDPAGPGQVDFGPGVQIGEILVGAGGPVQAA